MITKLSIQRVAAMMMGVWFLSSSFAAYAAGLIAASTAIENPTTDLIDPLQSLDAYTSVFGNLAIVAVVFGIVVLAISPVLQRRMHGIH